MRNMFKSVPNWQEPVTMLCKVDVSVHFKCVLICVKYKVTCLTLYTDLSSLELHRNWASPYFCEQPETSRMRCLPIGSGEEPGENG